MFLKGHFLHLFIFFWCQNIFAQNLVSNGIDVLERSSFSQLKGLRIGLITNHSGVNREHVLTADLLHQSDHVNLIKLFGPEHGIRGQLKDDIIHDSVDAKTGLQVISLYGNHKAPLPQHLQDIDTLVFDIQDIGTRFFTYISTLKLSMEAAAKYKKRFIVLDRINPIGGDAVEGPAEVDREVFVGIHPIPIRHGMTVGELALMFKAEKKWDLDLQVVRVDGWKRKMSFEQTGIKWLKPSPAMHKPVTALLYPGTALAEFEIATGRGTEETFEFLGAPYVDAKVLVERVQRNTRLAGVKISPYSFTPTDGLFSGIACQGLRFEVTAPNKFEPLKLGLAVAVSLYQLYPRKFSLEKLNVLLLHSATIDGIRSGMSFGQIWASWERSSRNFEKRSKPYLIYD